VSFAELLEDLERLVTDPAAFILLDFQGKAIGSTNGDLSILQIGLPLKTYIVDAITTPEDINKLGLFLRDRKLRKVVWDGRLGYSELWHRYGIRLENVLDLQLVYLHERYDVTQRKCVPLNGKVTAIKEKKLLSLTAVENEQKRMNAFDLINIRTPRVGSRTLE
jgi:hypothetical protein